MKRLTLTSKLVFGGVAAVLISISSMGIFSTIRHSSDLEAGARDRLHSTAQNMVELVQLALVQEMNLAKEIAVGNTTIDVATRVTKEGSESAAAPIAGLKRKLMSAQTNVGENYEAIVVAGLNGIVYADSLDGKLQGMEIGDGEYFKLAKQGKYNTGNVSKSKLSGDPIIPIAAPILSEQKELVGILTVIVKVDYLIERVAKAKAGQSGYAFMVDQNGIVNAHPNRDLIFKLDIKTEPGMQNMARALLAGESGAASYTFEGREMVAGYAPIPMAKWYVVVTESVDELRAPIKSMQKQMAVIGAILLLVIAGAVFFLGRRISRPIATIVDGLFDASHQISSAAGHLSSSSLQLAEGASEQAAAIEETSSSLEEMSSMTKQNAGNAHEANNLMSGTKDTVARASQSMEMLTTSMGEISRASEETSKIIRTIDEIAFQTNLLALNAAVEAARAGEAGAGFAVVADEVRNLAMRAAEAAKSTADLIEGTVKKIREGSDLMQKTDNEFQEMAKKVGKSGELVCEIAAASGEQSQGIEQVNRAMSEIDKVVQQDAANAQETASASEEMNAQAERMKDFVRELVAMVGSAN